jgi:hypothetical protein
VPRRVLAGLAAEMSRAARAGDIDAVLAINAEIARLARPESSGPQRPPVK